MRTVAHDRDRYAVIWALGEALLQHDELAANWRARHVVMVERMIGSKSGPVGRAARHYLRSRLPVQYYPSSGTCAASSRPSNRDFRRSNRDFWRPSVVEL